MKGYTSGFRQLLGCSGERLQFISVGDIEEVFIMALKK
jgi:hypothetical protein